MAKAKKDKKIDRNPKPTIESMRDLPPDNQHYFQGEEYLTYTGEKPSFLGLHGFAVECDQIADIIIQKAEVVHNRLTLADGTVVTGLHFKLYPYNSKGERKNYHFESYCSESDGKPWHRVVEDGVVIVQTL